LQPSTPNDGSTETAEPIEPAEQTGPSKERTGFGIPPALRYPAYRAYWFGLLASVSGFQMFRVGQGWLIYEITGSPWSLGLVGAANAIPAIFFNLFGGVFADRLDKRRLIIATQLTTGSLIFLLATLTLLGWVETWHVLAIALLAGGVEAFDNPARQALYPHLIDRKVMMSAVAMNSVIWQGTRIIAPGIAGILIDLINTDIRHVYSWIRICRVGSSDGPSRDSANSERSAGQSNSRHQRRHAIHPGQFHILVPDRDDLLQQFLWHGLRYVDANLCGGHIGGWGQGSGYFAGHDRGRCIGEHTLDGR
jgi:hypothetical protein